MFGFFSGFGSNIASGGVDDGQNHNEFAGWDEKLMRDGKIHPMYGDCHC